MFGVLQMPIGGTWLWIQDGYRRSMLLTFTFTVNPEKNEVAYAGNMGLQEALSALQQIVIADAVNKARQEALTKPADTDKMDGKV